jgi:hypothetical protein
VSRTTVIIDAGELDAFLRTGGKADKPMLADPSLAPHGLAWDKPKGAWVRADPPAAGAATVAAVPGDAAGVGGSGVRDRCMVPMAPVAVSSGVAPYPSGLMKAPRSLHEPAPRIRHGIAAAATAHCDGSGDGRITSTGHAELRWRRDETRFCFVFEACWDDEDGRTLCIGYRIDDRELVDLRDPSPLARHMLRAFAGHVGARQLGDALAAAFPRQCGRLLAPGEDDFARRWDVFTEGYDLAADITARAVRASTIKRVAALLARWSRQLPLTPAALAALADFSGLLAAHDGDRDGPLERQPWASRPCRDWLHVSVLARR